jgi:predicted metal-binding protein
MGGRKRYEAGDLKAYLDKAVAMGASRAEVIKAATIRCAPWVRLKCQFGCGGFNKRLTCPPFTPTPEETARTVACYRRAILMHAHDNDVVNEIVPKLEREIFLDGYFKALGFGSGPCRLCPRCDTKARCKYPDIARPSMEACGMDVFATVRANGFHIEVVRTKRQRGDYYGVILVD